MKLDILHPEIFPKEKVFAGVTKKNQHLFPKSGLTFIQSEICTREDAEGNKIVLANEIKVNSKNLKFQKQVHGTLIRKIDHLSQEETSDGMITNRNGVVLCLRLADCGGILIFDPINNAIGALHSGWQGTKQNICLAGIHAMMNAYNSKPEDMLVYLTPCASGKNYEVDTDVAKFFPQSIVPIENGKFLFDNVNEMLLQLDDCGVVRNNIEVSGICTIEDEDYHSYRRDGDLSGRMCAYIGMYK